MNKIAEQARLRASLEELARFGCPVDLSVADTRGENEEVEVEQVGGVIESQLFELEDGRVACMADIAVTNQTSRTISVVDVELRATWDDSLFQWLTPLQVVPRGRTKRSPAYLAYRFPGGQGIEFAYDEVINHQLLERKKLPGKCRLKGWLLAIGDLMPIGLRHGQMLDMQLGILGADHVEYSAHITLWTDRLSAAPKKKLKPRTRIFAELVEEAAVQAGDANRTAPPPAGPSPDGVQNLGSVGRAQKPLRKK